MATICYTWDDCPFPWNDTPFTWKEGCIIEKILSGRNSKIHDRIKKLNNDEKRILIGLFVRLQVDEIEIEKRINKHKNTKVKIKLKDVQITEKVQKNININVKIQ